MLYVVVVLCVALVVAVVVLVRPVIVSQTLIVHTVTGQSLRGVSRGRGPSGVTLVHARHLDADVDLDGDVFVPRRQIHFVQKVST